MYKEIKLKSPDIKYNDMIINIQQVMGIGRESVCKTISEYRKYGVVTSLSKTRAKTSLFDKIDDLDRNRLRKKVHSLWLRHELPTINNILFEVNEDAALPNFKRTTLYSIIKKLDFEFVKKKKFCVLTEKEDLIVCRRNYLYNIRKYREEGRPIYYLDETWLIAGETTDSKNCTSKRKRFIVLHIGSNKGFLPGGLLCFESKTNSSDYQDEMNGNNFTEWFESILPYLEPNSIIVMDNAPYHSVESEKIPSFTSTKSEILNWLNSKGIIFNRPMLKPQLLVKVHELRPRFTSFIIDNLARNSGHIVLRLPPYHHEFNPIDLAWAMVKGYVKQTSTIFKVDDFRQVLNKAIEQVTSENWKTFIQHVIEEENKIWKVDDIVDEIMDKIDSSVFVIKDEPSSSDSLEY